MERIYSIFHKSKKNFPFSSIKLLALEVLNMCLSHPIACARFLNFDITNIDNEILPSQYEYFWNLIENISHNKEKVSKSHSTNSRSRSRRKSKKHKSKKSKKSYRSKKKSGKSKHRRDSSYSDSDSDYSNSSRFLINKF